ncbi:MAG: iron-sulfur protein, partial [Lachnospiraceae bacterium]|nr:iron-sulfur protein [Lachnospiraceae bacterium]
RGLSADMDDLLSKKGQVEARKFFSYVLWSIKQKSFEPFPAPRTPAPRVAVTVPTNAASGHESPSLTAKKVAIVTDCREEDTQLKSMIERFQSVLPCESHVINIREYPMRGGCLGCFHCASDGKCVYTDGFDRFLREEIQTSDAIVYAFTISDHSMGSVFKCYDDRQFCNGHRTVTMGSPIGYLVSGSYSAEPNLQMILEGRSQVGGNFLAGVATDETDPDHEIDRLALTLNYALSHHHTQPQNFYGVGGMKIFRDLIYLMQGMMKADHQFYKAHGQYDFPQKHMGTMLKMYLVGALLSSPKLKEKVGGHINEGMIAPYKKVVDGAKR